EGLFNEEDAPPIAPPVTGFPGVATYECNDAQMSLHYTMLSSDVTEVWTRVSP
ncbi:MAG: hypothetical protein IT315_08210, partial [Anaerolineales bacterium]|nr:hypothetical protein [Anaerolineales bacterium]